MQIENFQETSNTIFCEKYEKKKKKKSICHLVRQPIQTFTLKVPSQNL